MAKKKDVSAIVSGAGFAASFWTALDKAVRAKGGTDEDIYRLGTPEGEGLIGSFAGMVVALRRPKLLEPIGTVAVSLLPEFIAKDRFVADIGKSTPVKISWLGDNFKDWFMGKVESPTVGVALRYGKLMEPSVDDPILAELGETAGITLGQVFYMMMHQLNGEEEPLSTNGCANIFYVIDVNNTLRAVRAFWYGGGWYVNAYSVGGPYAWNGGPYAWNDGDWVFSRNS